MRARLLRLPVLRGLPAMGRGFLEGMVDVVILWMACALITFFVPIPSIRLFSSSAEIGATLLIAFAVEVTWLIKASDRSGGRREEWIGLVSSSGIAGLIGILVSLALVEHLNAGHANWLDRLGFAWVFASLVLLGAAVAVQPVMTYAWRRGEERD